MIDTDEARRVLTESHDIERVADVLEDALTTITELRAVLAPLLDDPLRCVIVSEDEGRHECVFCGDDDHDPGCPVLRADELLGR